MAILVLIAVLSALRQRRRPFHTFQPIGPLQTFQVIGADERSPPLERLLIRRLALKPQTCERAVADLSQADVVWSTSRHDDTPTTDIELSSSDQLAWLDNLLSNSVLDVLFADIARGFGVSVEHLFLRELFAVKYECRGQRALPLHRDSSFFSFIIQLSHPTSFSGGGTRFAHAPRCLPLTVEQGAAFTFVGQQQHGAAEVSGGVRLILAGFVDLRAPLCLLHRLGLRIRQRDPRFIMSVCREWCRPYQRHSVVRLERVSGRKGAALLQLLASRRLPLPHIDTAPLEEGCSRWLRREPVDEVTRRFIERVLARASTKGCHSNVGGGGLGKESVDPPLPWGPPTAPAQPASSCATLSQNKGNADGTSRSRPLWIRGRKGCLRAS